MGHRTLFAVYKISELAAKTGLSRTALLYYEKQGLISGHRLENGYRVYSDKDLQRVRLIQQLQAGGLTLKECKVCLEAKVDKDLLRRRLEALEADITQKQQSRKLLMAMLGDGDLKAWHKGLNETAPDAHLDWLMKQGFTEKEALQLKRLSKDMNEHEKYMADFMRVFGALEYWGPGSEQDTLKALALVPKAPEQILDIGCGKGLATLALANNSSAKITALDNEQSALDRLEQRFAQLGYSDRLQAVCGSMTELPFEKSSFDLIWSEGSAYVMGLENALRAWKPYLQEQGYLVMSEMVWRTETPSKVCIEFWNQEYSDIQTVPTRIEQMKKAGYRIVEHFSQSEEAWWNYYVPFGKTVAELEPEMPSSAALKDLKREVEMSSNYSNEFGYHVFVLANR